jgi:hypothetical protein
VPVNPRFYTHLYGEALQKLGWRPEQVTAEFQAVATEACGR